MGGGGEREVAALVAVAGGRVDLVDEGGGWC